MRKVLMMGLILLGLNSLSFMVARVTFCLSGNTAAKFEHAIVDQEDRAMTYLVAGNLNQPRAAFRFLQPELSGNATYLQFRMVGWSARATAEKIADDIRTRRLARTSVYTISLGDHVGRYLEAMIAGLDWDLRVIAINPCTDVDFMRKPLGALLKIGAPVLELCCCGLGWLSTIPVISTPGGGYSLVLLADQYWSIAYDHPVRCVENTVGVICSRPGEEDNDGLLENSVIRNYFQRDS